MVDLIAVVGVQTIANPIRYQFHPEVWAMILGLLGAYVYMVRVVGPKAVPAGQPIVTRRQVVFFSAAMVLLWIASDWPIHDIGEDYLYSVHMTQHMIISYFVPPLALMGTPTWLARLIIGDGAVYRFFKRLTQPVVAALIFNAVVILLHIPQVVNLSIENGPFHYFMHLLVMVTSLIMWAPVCGPIPEFRIGSGAAMVYLFLQSMVPTIPAGWLTFAESPVYAVYDRPVRLWGLSLTDDQQLAGAIMKTGGGLYLWMIIIYLFFGRFVKQDDQNNSFRHKPTGPTGDGAQHAAATGSAPGSGAAGVLTTADVEAAFAESEPMPEPHSR